jgi:hypothetical protein
MAELMSMIDYEIALATSVDIAGILELQEQNLSRRGGMLSVALSQEWFEKTLNEMAVIVARNEGASSVFSCLHRLQPSRTFPSLKRCFMSIQVAMAHTFMDPFAWHIASGDAG